MCAQVAAANASQKQNKKGKKNQPLQINFSEIDDLFLNTKGKQARNLRKKLDKYKELDKQARKGELQLNAQQKQQVETIPSIQEEIDELEALCRLYMESNPNYNQKDKAAEITAENVRDAVRSSLALVGNVASLSALIDEDASFVECSDAERASLLSVNRIYSQMAEAAAEGSKTFQDSRKTSDFADAFEKLSRSSADTVTDGGVTFEELNAFVTRCFTDNAQIVQRISDKELAAKREAAAAQEEADKLAAAAEAEEEAKGAEEEKEEEPAAAEEEAQPEETADAPVEESKDTSEVKEAEADGGDKPADERAIDQPAGDEEGAAAQDGRGGRGYRGDRRGGRGNRGGRGGHRGGRGGYNRGPREDEDGFVTATDEKPKPRYRGNNYRGGRRGDRGDMRGGRGGRGSDGNWDRRGGRGQRPQTAGGAESAAASGNNQPAAASSGAQAANTTGPSEV